MPLPLSVRSTLVFIAAIPMAGIAAIKNVTLTCAPLIGAPLDPVSFTLKTLLPFRGGVGSVVSSILPLAAIGGAFIAAAAPAPGGGGTNAPAAACNCASESIRKLAEVTRDSPGLIPFRTT